jgi:hypothetical protein
LRRKLLICAAAIAIFVVVAAALGTIVFFSPLVTHYIESDAFRVGVEKETANGLHFPIGHYSAIRRTSPLTAQAESFATSNGERALKLINARGITARFDPWGVFIRQWRFSEIHVGSGEVEIQIYQSHAEEVASKPWFAVFLPNRVYLKRIEAERADVTWRFRGERAGFFGTHLLITPHGQEFDYAATGGKLKMAMLPTLYLRRADVLITKTALTLHNIDLAPAEKSDGNVRGVGTAGIGKDRSIDFSANFDRVPIRSWLPDKWKQHLDGSAFGVVHWTGNSPKLEDSSGQGSLDVEDGRADNLPFLEKLAELAREKSFEHLELTDCSLNFNWRYPAIEIKDIGLEEKGKFRVEGAISIDHRALSGTIQLGVARKHLDWLPNPEEIFTPGKGRGYLWTTVHLSGTIDQPQQDLSPRIIELFKESPGAYLQLLFRQFEGWLKQTFGGD